MTGPVDDRYAWQVPCAAGDGLVDSDAAHFPHGSGCGFDTVGSCACDTVVHPGCCPDCKGEAP